MERQRAAAPARIVPIARLGPRPLFEFVSAFNLQDQIDSVGFERAAREISPARTTQGNFENHIRSVVQSMLLEAGFRCDDAELVRETFQRFEEAVREIQRHLLGIKQQNYFVMR